MIKRYETGKYSFQVSVTDESVTSVELYLLRGREPLLGVGSFCHPIVDGRGRVFDLTSYIVRLEQTESKRVWNQVLADVDRLLLEILASYCALELK
jgi:hypothetical protein